MEKISEAKILDRLETLNIPMDQLKVNGTAIHVHGGGVALQLQRIRLALIQGGLECRIDQSENTVTVVGPNRDPEFVKFIKSAPPGSSAFEGLAAFNLNRVGETDEKSFQRMIFDALEPTIGPPTA